jgi:hypothetical protein
LPAARRETGPELRRPEAACEAFCDEVNGREHRVTRRVPAEMAAEERHRLHRLPDAPFTVAFGVTRTVGANTPVIADDRGEYWCPVTSGAGQCGSVPTATTSMITHVASTGAVEVARHERTTPGSRNVPEHGDRTPECRLHRTPRATNDAEAAFLPLGARAALWLSAAGEVGVVRLRPKWPRP